MDKKELTPEEVAILIRSRKILKDRGIPKDTDVSSICKIAGISRKTGYQWVGKTGYQWVDRMTSAKEKESILQREHDRLNEEHDKLKQLYERARFENKGRKIAWEIHGVDEYIASKKNTAKPRKSQKLLHGVDEYIASKKNTAKPRKSQKL